MFEPQPRLEPQPRPEPTPRATRGRGGHGARGSLVSVVSRIMREENEPVKTMTDLMRDPKPTAPIDPMKRGPGRPKKNAPKFFPGSPQYEPSQAAYGEIAAPPKRKGRKPKDPFEQP